MIPVAETAADLDAYARVWSEVHPDKPIPAARSGAASPNGTTGRGRAAAVVAVLPAHRRRGIGSALLDASLAHARSLDATSVSGSLAEAELPWAERRAFEEFDRAVEFVLELAGVVEGAIVPDAVEIGELQESELDEAHLVYAEGVADIPSPEPLESSFEKFRKSAEIRKELA